MPSWAGAAIGTVPPTPHGFEDLRRGLGRDGSAAAPEDPDALFLSQRRPGPYRTQRHPIAFGFQFQCVTRLQVKLIPKRLWDNDPSGLIDGHTGCHNGCNNGIYFWGIPFVKPSFVQGLVLTELGAIRIN